MTHSTYSACLLSYNKTAADVRSNLRSSAEYRKQVFSRFTRTTTDRETVAHKFLARLAGSWNGNEVLAWLQTLTRSMLTSEVFFLTSINIAVITVYITRFNLLRFTGTYMRRLFRSMCKYTKLQWL